MVANYSTLQDKQITLRQFLANGNCLVCTNCLSKNTVQMVFS